MSLIGLWAFFFNDGVGVDGSGNGNAALFRNGAAQDTDGRVVLDGVDDYVEIAHAPQYAVTNATIHGSFTLDAGSLDGSRSSSITDPTLQTLVSRDSSGYDGGGHLSIYIDGDGSLLIRHQSSTQDYEIRSAAGTVQEGQEFDLVYSFSDTGGMVAYINGVEVGANSSPVTNGDSLALSQNSEPWTLGASQVSSGDGIADNLSQYLDGKIGHFEVYDQALPPSELNTLHDYSDGVDDGHILGTSGNDTIHGGNAISVADGGAVINDTIEAGAGNDVVYAGDGDDFVLGGGGDDNIIAGGGADRVRGGAGNDTVAGGAGNDLIDGGAGADVINGEAGDDEIRGGDGNDLLYGEQGNDIVFGDAGDDVIYSGAGNDYIHGGEGSDQVIILDGFGHDTIVGGELGSDVDTLDFLNLTTSVTITFSAAEAGSGIVGWDTVEFSEFEHFFLSNQSDSVDGSASTSYIGILAGAGNDTVTTGSGDDLVYGEAGDDSVEGGLGNDSLFGGVGNDTLSGGAGNDSITGGAGDDVVYTGSGADTVETGEGSDTVYLDDDDGGGSNVLTDSGTSGVDKIVLATGAGTYRIQGTFSAASGFEIIDGSGATGDQLGTNDSFANFDFTGITLTGVDEIIGTGNADTIIGSAGADSISGAAGNDSLSGGAGTDTIDGGLGDDTILGGAGNDSLFGGDGNDLIEGGDGDDGIQGGAGNDTIYGDGGIDRIQGGTGDDLIFAGDGDDLARGGAGADTLYGGQGSDRLRGDDGNDYLWGDDFSAIGGNDTLLGDAGDDTLDGNAGDDLLTGGAGNDYFLVSDGHDTISDFNTGNTGALGDGDIFNNDYLNLAGYYDSLDELRADQADDGILNQSNTLDDEGKSVDYSDNTRFWASRSMTVQGASAESYSYDNTGVICFASGTMVRTPLGEKAVDELQEGDLVQTLEHGAQPVIWISETVLSKESGTLTDKTTPVRIKPGALGNTKALIVSPQHCLLMRDRSSSRTAFVRARHLADETNLASYARGRKEICYVHVLLPRHATLVSNGLPSESFYPGRSALEMMPSQDRWRLRRQLPNLDVTDVASTYGPRAHEVMRRAEVKKLFATECLNISALELEPRALRAETSNTVISINHLLRQPA